MSPELLQKIYLAHQTPKNLPGISEIESFINDLLQFLFPELNNRRLTSELEVKTHAQILCLDFQRLLNQTQACKDEQGRCKVFFDRLDQVYTYCLEDSEAILQGDPAANDNREVIRSYPGFFAIAVYRIAHLMYQLEIPYLPRIFTEYAHSKTGIDIHPGATIGRRFCIDHGTGVVIGETTNIGDDVKIYQGVTLGALSVKKNMAKHKRHPTIQSGVVIYAGATILGGETVIGQNSIIGGSVWITKSVPPYSTVYYSGKSSQTMNLQP